MGIGSRKTRPTKAADDNGAELPDNELIRAHVARVEIKSDQLVIMMRNGETSATILVPWIKQPSKSPREIIRPSDGKFGADKRPIRSETRVNLVKAIANGRRWLEEMVAGQVTNVDQIAKRENCSVRQVNRIIALAFLAPDLVQAAIDGRLPRGIGVETLRDCPIEWRQQRLMLGLAS